MKKILNLLSPKWLKLALIAAPLLVAAIYLVFIAADRYVSESIVTVRRADQGRSGALPGIAMLLSGSNPSSHEDGVYLHRYIYSQDMLNILEKRLKLREHFQSATWDPFYRLHDGITKEEFLKYYQSRVEVVFDDLSSVLTIKVQGFDPAYAQRLNMAIVEESERFVNNYSQKISREQMAFAEDERHRSEERLRDIKSRLLDFQGKNRLLDPMAQAKASEARVVELQANLTRRETELKDMLTYLNDDSFQVKAIRGQIDAIRAQLSSESANAAGSSNDNRINALAVEFQDLTTQAVFAEETYKLATTAVENARIDAARKAKSMVVIESPTLPEEPTYPRRIYTLLTLLVVCTLVYAISRLVIATIRDHQE